MGMFDYVHFEMDCPTCGAKVGTFQSKDASCNLDILEPDRLQHFYSDCRECKAWIEFFKPPPDPFPLRDTSLTLDEIHAIGFVMTVTPFGALPEG